MDINNLLRQHNEIFDLVKQIRTYDSKEKVNENAATIAKSLAKLSGIIKMHLLSEDQFLYPVLSKHENSKVRNTAMLFDTEMGKLAKVFEEYKMKYVIASKIIQNTAGFLLDTKAIFTALEKRIKKEDLELYPLLK